MPIIDELKADLATAESNAKAWVRGELPGFASDAEEAVAKVAAAGQAALDTAATAYTPTFAPAAIPIINDLVAGAVTVSDAKIAAIEAELAAEQAKNATLKSVASAT